MKNKHLSFFLGFILLFFNSCGYQEGVREPDRQSYIQFTGEPQGTMAIVDEAEPIALGKTSYIDKDTGKKIEKKGRMLYLVAPGKHEIIVEKNGEVVVHRTVMINAGSTKEIYIP